MNLYHYYHVYADGDWERIVGEHCEALQDSGLADALTDIGIGIVGHWSKYDEVMEFVYRNLPPDKVYTLALANEGFEQVTINKMREAANVRDPGLVLYAHTKGSAFPGAHPDRWRQVMSDECIGNWECVVSEMDLFNYDTCGCYFIEEGIYSPGVPVFAGVHGVSSIIHRLQEETNGEFEYEIPDEPQPILKRVHYSGNYWWTTVNWLRKLPYPCPENTRYDAEMYIGRAVDGSLPFALNLRTGSPFTELR